MKINVLTRFRLHLHLHLHLQALPKIVYYTNWQKSQRQLLTILNFLSARTYLWWEFLIVMLLVHVGSVIFWWKPSNHHILFREHRNNVTFTRGMILMCGVHSPIIRTLCTTHGSFLAIYQALNNKLKGQDHWLGLFINVCFWFSEMVGWSLLLTYSFFWKILYYTIDIMIYFYTNKTYNSNLFRIIL